MFLKEFVFIISVIKIVQCLPATTYPISYYLWMDVTKSWENENFDGRIEIEIGIAEQTSQIFLSYTFSSIALNYQAELYELQGGQQIREIPTKKIELQNAWNQCVIELEEEDAVLEIGNNYLVIIHFVSYFDRAARGVYFQSEDFYTTEKKMIATNFMPNYAHLAFPCYDEPFYKARIKLTIVHGDKYNAVASMPIELQTVDEENGVVTTTFERSPLLSVHSFGFAVSKLKNVIADKKLKFVAYYDETHDTDDVQLVIDVEDKILGELEKYLGVALDLVQISEVPQYDSMYIKIGTYGILFNDYEYYYCGSSATLFQREEIIRRTARLISNQYFSNIVSPNGWEDAWITQGISVLLEYSILGTDFAYLNSMDTFLIKLYSFMSYKKVYYVPGGVDMTRNLIDRNYEWKSAEFMFMLQNIVTQEIFQTFLQKLVVDYRNVPISTAQFLEELTDIAHENDVLPSDYHFATIMTTWLDQPGSPVVAVTRDYDTGQITLTVSSILDWGSDDTSWWVPYNYIIGSNDNNYSSRPKGWIEGTSSVEVDLSEELNSTEWILFNINQSGYYHTIYDHQNWLLLADQLSADHEKIPYINRGDLLSDAFSFGYEKRVPLDVAFSIASYLHKEESTYPFRLLFGDEFSEIDTNLYASDVYTNYTIFMRHQMRNIYKRVRATRLVQELEYDEISLRNSVTQFACRMHLKECLEDANEIFEKYYSNPEEIESAYESDLGYNLMMYGFIMSNETIFWDVFNKINDGGSEKNYYTDMIGMTENPVHTQYLLDILLTRNGETYNGVTINLDRYVRYIIYGNLIKNNLEVLERFYEILEEQAELVDEIYSFHYAQQIVQSLFRATTTEERLEKLIAAAKQYETATQDFSVMISKARVVVKWNTERSVEFQDVLARQVELIQEGEKEEEPEPTTPEDDGGSAPSLPVSILTILILPMIVRLIS